MPAQLEIASAREALAPTAGMPISFEVIADEFVSLDAVRVFHGDASAAGYSL